MEITQEVIQHLPQTPGVYIYKNEKKEIIYVGKAINLCKRVKQYFQRDDAVGTKTPLLVSEIASIDVIQTQSEFEALLLEARLIKEYQPKYNVIAKDDKSPLYVVMALSENLPQIFFGRKPKETTVKVEKGTLYFGPFQSAKTARGLMRSLRHVVPYCTQKQRNGKKCFYTHLGLCSPCASYIAKLLDSPEKDSLTKEYRKHIFRLRDILSGKAYEVIKDMDKDMLELSKKQHFEEAALLRNQLQALRELISKKYDPSLYIQSDTLIQELVDKEQSELLEILQPYYPHLNSLHRIECYDISNTMGTFATASMVVMTDGTIDKSNYRKFKINTLKTPNDFAMMKEVLKRRFLHTEWEFPNLIVIDGGKGQVHTALGALNELINPDLHSIAIVGLAKRQEEIVIPIGGKWKILRLPYSSGGLKLIQRLRDEAHRFAITYHKLLRNKASLN